VPQSRIFWSLNWVWHTRSQHKRELSGSTREIDADDTAPMLESPESEILVLIKEKTVLEKVMFWLSLSWATHLMYDSVAPGPSVDQ